MLEAPLPADLGDGTPRAPRLIVETWLAVPGREGARVLMLERSPQRGGFWQGVSGRVERGDGSLAGAVRRELREEIDLAPEAIWDLGRWYTFVSPFSGRTFRKRSLGVLLAAGTTADGLRLSREHVAARLVTFDEARALVRWPENAEELTRLEARLRAEDPAH